MRIGYCTTEPLDVSINQKAKKCVSYKFNIWYREQLKKGVASGDVKASMKMSELKPLHTRWIVDMHTYLKQQRETTLKGVEKGGIKEALKSANEVFARIKNPFAEKRANEMKM